MHVYMCTCVHILYIYMYMCTHMCTCNNTDDMIMLKFSNDKLFVVGLNWLVRQVSNALEGVEGMRCNCM